MKTDLVTKWGRELDPANVLQEYPRPSMKRESYINLNGYWNCRIISSQEPYEGMILVPFSPEAPLSGVNRQLRPGETLKYHRTFNVGLEASFEVGGSEAAEVLSAFGGSEATETSSVAGGSEAAETSSASGGSEAAETSPVSGGSEVAETWSASRIADAAGRRTLLHFGAVDQRCEVFVNGRAVGSHAGGYLPFTFDITAALKRGENDLDVNVQDDSDTSFHARGKQTLHAEGMWYTAQSGIWQTVWIEQVPETYITGLKITPDLDSRQVKLKVSTNHSAKDAGNASAGQKNSSNVQNDYGPESKNKYFAERESEQTADKFFYQITLNNRLICEGEGKAGASLRIPLPEVHPWTPDDPQLYDMTITLGEDEVQTYFAMRKISRRNDKNGIPRFYLNNKPCYMSGVLDQGYWPDGLYTAPSDEALQSDILAMKNLGFNMLRKHNKIEPERWYYHCDRLGMLVWQDMVNGGEDYSYFFVTLMPTIFLFTQRCIPDESGDHLPRIHPGRVGLRCRQKLVGRQSTEGRQEYLRETKETIRTLYNHPCIVAWVPFNEGWGQFDAAYVSKLVKKMDPSRLIDEASGWFDQKGGDIYSIHNYFLKLKVRPRKDRVTALTECGGYCLTVSEHNAAEDETYGYRKYDTAKKLFARITTLWEEELLANVPNGLSASVYTQVSDVESETNGFLTYDREVLKVPAEEMKALNQKLISSVKPKE